MSFDPSSNKRQYRKAARSEREFLNCKSVRSTNRNSRKRFRQKNIFICPDNDGGSGEEDLHFCGVHSVIRTMMIGAHDNRMMNANEIWANDATTDALVRAQFHCAHPPSVVWSMVVAMVDDVRRDCFCIIVRIHPSIHRAVRPSGSDYIECTINHNCLQPDTLKNQFKCEHLSVLCEWHCMVVAVVVGWYVDALQFSILSECIFTTHTKCFGWCTSGFGKALSHLVIK